MKTPLLVFIMMLCFELAPGQNIDSLQLEKMKFKGYAKSEIIGGGIVTAAGATVFGAAYGFPFKSRDFYFAYCSGIVGFCTGLIVMSIGFDDLQDYVKIKRKIKNTQAVLVRPLPTGFAINF